jgi:type IV fimbrial biogenesis protein FimT
MMLSRNRGVTLIELLISVALGFILIMLAVPAYNTWTSDAEVSSAASSIADGLRKASAEAIKQNTAVEFVLAPAVGWRARLVSTGTVVTQDRFAEGAKRATLAASPPGSTTVTFNSLGGIELANADASAPLDFVNVNAAGAVRSLRVLVGTTRNGVRVCDPKFAFAADPKGC